MNIKGLCLFCTLAKARDKYPHSRMGNVVEASIAVTMMQSVDPEKVERTLNPKMQRQKIILPAKLLVRPKRQHNM